MELAAPQRFARRHQRGASLNTAMPSPLGQLNSMMNGVDLISSPPRGSEVRTLSTIEVNALRSRYNRMVGQEIEQTFVAGGASSNWIRRYYGGLQLAVASVGVHYSLITALRALDQILTGEFDPPDQNMMELPDKNDY